MYKIEATVTAATDEEIKLKAGWPLVWLQAQGGITILRKPLPFETPLVLSEPVQNLEIEHVSNRLGLRVGDRVIVQLRLST